MNRPTHITLLRLFSSDQGTEGVLMVPDLGFACHTLELPWRGNQTNISCIPPGTYPMVWRETQRRATYHITGVPHRSFILIHSGNLAGDTRKGFQTHAQGCILLGRRMGWLYNQRAVLISRATVKQFHRLMDQYEARITILDTPGERPCSKGA